MNKKSQSRRRLYLRQHYFLLAIVLVLAVICLIQCITISNLKIKIAKNQNPAPIVSFDEYFPSITPNQTLIRLPYDDPTPTPKPTPLPMATIVPIPSLIDPEDEYTGPVLDPVIGTVEGPSGKETYYNLPMDYVVEIMRDLGYSEEDFPYWEREDGCKMFGPYIMCAADLSTRPKGTILMSSLGLCMVCDTGEFVNWNSRQIDIAVNW